MKIAPTLRVAANPNPNPCIIQNTVAIKYSHGSVQQCKHSITRRKEFPLKNGKKLKVNRKTSDSAWTHSLYHTSDVELEGKPPIKMKNQHKLLSRWEYAEVEIHSIGK